MENEFHVPRYQTREWLAQRDKRTRFRTKKWYVYWMLIASIFFAVSFIGLQLVYQHCPCINDTDKGFWIYGFVVLGVWLGFTCFNLFAWFNPDYMWRHLNTSAECVGDDVEDCTPFYLSITGKELEQRGRHWFEQAMWVNV